MSTTSERRDLDVWLQIPATWKTYQFASGDRRILAARARRDKTGNPTPPLPNRELSR
jgi:hypothetical protein